MKIFIKTCIVFVALLIVGVYALMSFVRFADTHDYEKVTTDSMSPTYKIGDYVYTYWTKEYEVGDAVVFSCNNPDKCRVGEHTNHRLVSIKPDGCMVIIGDNPKYDWSIEQCFYPEDINILGVTHKLF